MEIADKIKALKGPILVLGAGGFVGANLFQMFRKYRTDVYGVATWKQNCRIQDEGLFFPGRLTAEGMRDFLGRFKHVRTVFNCIAHGGYSWQKDKASIYQANFDLTRSIVDALSTSDFLVAYVHAGSSSEYGDNCSGPLETDPCRPNSDYAISKLAATNYICLAAKHGFPGAVLRLYSIYGPWEDSRRLIPSVVAAGRQGQHAEYSSPGISRDFVYVDDACEAFVDAAVQMPKLDPSARVFNIATGYQTTLKAVAAYASNVFGLKGEPEYTMSPRDWDREYWYGSPYRAKHMLGWQAKILLPEGIVKTSQWMAEQHAD